MKRTANNINKENIKYLKRMFGKENESDTFFRIRKKVRKCLRAMKDFGDNQWWTSKDKRVIAYYQLQSRILLVPVEEFVEALRVLLGRDIWSHEVWYNWEGVKAEAEKAFCNVPYTEEEKKANIAKSFEKLENLGIEVICVRKI